MYECPVPSDKCAGSNHHVEPGNRTMKIHPTLSDVRKCVAHYLQSLGYKKGQNNQFSKDDDSPILVMHRKPGMRMRKGKEGRFQPISFRSTWKLW